MAVEGESGPDPAVCIAISPLRRADLAIEIDPKRLQFRFIHRVTGCPPTTMAQDTINITGGDSAHGAWAITEPPSPSGRSRPTGKGKTASVDEKSDGLPIKVVTGEEDADASDSTAFDDLDLDNPVTAPASVVEPPSQESPVAIPVATGTVTGRRAEDPEPVAMSGNRVMLGLNDHPDWSLVAKAFEGFIPVCKTIADIEGTEVRYRALSRRGRRTR